MWHGIVGGFFSIVTFKHYVDTLGNPPVWAKFIVLHNTAPPTLKMRPKGFSHQNMIDLQSYYRDTKGWSAGPHLFIDDNGIWVFTPLKLTGVHSPSWNGQSWGVEMLGDYDTDIFTSGRGAKVRDNAVAAIAILDKWANLDSSTLRRHGEDPNTTHTNCPGHNVSKPDMIARIHSYKASL